jgi:hypothetical protein
MTSKTLPTGARPVADRDEILAAALHYASRGRAVFPAASDKAPLIGRGFKAASADPERIRRWWARFPDALIGLPTGNGLLAVDVDPPRGTVDPAWPKTLTARTRSGGWHFYYRVSKAFRCTASQLAPGVDTRCEVGYVIAPPSPGWQWVDPTCPIAPLPDAIAEKLTNRAARRAGAAPRRFVVRTEVSEGGRNDYLAGFTGWVLFRGVAVSQVAPVVHAHNGAVCRPPLEPDEVERIVASITALHERRPVPSLSPYRDLTRRRSGSHRTGGRRSSGPPRCLPVSRGEATT